MNLEEYYRYMNLANNWSDSPEERHTKLAKEQLVSLFPISLSSWATYGINSTKIRENLKCLEHNYGNYRLTTINYRINAVQKLM